MKQSLMHLLVFVLTLIALIPLSYSEPDFENSIVTTDVDISSSINIVPTASSYDVSEITAQLQLKPYEYFQQHIISSVTSPKGKETSDSIIFSWQDTEEKKLDFSVKSRIKTNNNRKQITEKIAFPIKDLQKEVQLYTQPTETIESDDPLIVAKASEIAQGEDDAFIAAVKVADWIKNNINYDLNTITSDSTKDAVWVLQNKEGVCDEITILFLAMLRSLNIPAKYSYGLAYSNLPQYNDFASHAWAEVYFPTYGWIPFDVTYGQFGYIDSSHIKLGESSDTNKSSVSYSWSSYNVDIESSQLNTAAKTVAVQPNPLGLVSMEIYPEKNDVGPNSYNLINIVIKNKKNYYVAAELNLVKPKELQSYADRKTVYLQPNEEKTVGFIVKTPAAIEKRMIYKYPISLVTSQNDSAGTMFQSTADDPVFSKSEIDLVLKGFEEEKQKVYSAEVDLDCSIDKPQSYQGEQKAVVCQAANKGNILLKGLKLCLAADCKAFDLGIAQKRSESFVLHDSNKIGHKEVTATLRSNEIFKKAAIKYIVLDDPALEIANISFPDTVTLGQSFLVNVAVAKSSFSDPKNVKIVLSSGYLKREARLPAATSDINMNFKDISAEELSAGQNTVAVQVYYDDNRGNSYQKNKQINITLQNVSALDKLKLFFIHLLRLY